MMAVGEVHAAAVFAPFRLRRASRFPERIPEARYSRNFSPCNRTRSHDVDLKQVEAGVEMRITKLRDLVTCASSPRDEESRER